MRGRARQAGTASHSFPRPKVNSTIPGESGASAGLSLPPASEQESLCDGLSLEEEVQVAGLHSDQGGLQNGHKVCLQQYKSSHM